MDLDSKAYSKLIDAWNTHGGSEDYRRILERLGPLTKRHDHETPEMWCSRIRDPFRKILEDNYSRGILSKNGYITMYENLIERSDRVHGLPSNYIYCSVCDSLVFISENGLGGLPITYQDNHLKRCISGNSISNEHARRNEILQSIDKREFQIWQYKQYILKEEAKINRLHLELFSQSTLHSEKDKLASVSYDLDARLTDYETYAQSKATMAKNTIPSAPKFEPAYITNTGQEMISPVLHQSSNCKSNTSEIFISSRYTKQNNLLPSIDHLNQNGVPALRLKDGILGYYQKVKNPETQEEYVIACEEFYAYFRKYYSKYIGIINSVKLTPPYEEYIYCSPSRWIEAKKYQLKRRLDRITYGPTSDYSERFVFELLSVIGYYESIQN
ncbi:hypothetical protein GLOIN_2v1834454 [Rhizophagus clarus]|uniref:Uncharacterized protein n=1 Tax=Rhizophagus clarus TaxID=94130 RepID=A0A8H3QSV5_9GLOM|nr:hypothetical protein GLOIN_2v1834454 [Rhizophagus clarus]